MEGSNSSSFSAAASGTSARDLYERGNEKFRCGDYEGAIMSYSQCIEGYNTATYWENSDGGGCYVVSGVVEEEADLLVKAMSNRSLCHLNLRNFESAVRDCSAVLRVQPGNEKIVLRRAKAKQCLGLFLDSLKDIDLAMASGSKVAPSLLQQALQLRRETLDLQRRDEAVRSAQGVPASFVNSEQSIKLVFNSPHIERMIINQPYQYRMSLCNVFGLFDRSLLSGCSGLSVEASLTVLSSGPSVVEEELFKVISLSDAAIGANGKVDFDFRIVSSSESSDTCNDRPITILIRFECIGRLNNGRAVIPITALPSILVSAPGQHTGLNESWRSLLDTASAIGAECIRDFDMNKSMLTSETHDIACKTRFRCFECTGSLSIAGKIWESAYVLLEYLQKHPDIIRGKSIIELGSGTGLAGIALSAMRPKRVFLSDMPETLPLLNANIRLNAEIIRFNMSSHCETIENRFDPSVHTSDLNYCAIGWMWGENDYLANRSDSKSAEKAPIAQVLQDCDLALASDVVYDPEGYEPLLKSILAFLHSGETSSCARRFIMAHRHRNPEDYRFFDALQATPGISVQEEALSGGSSADAPVPSCDATQPSAALANDVKIFTVFLQS